MPKAFMKTLILGLGNELYGDDGVGVHVIRHLRKEQEARSDWARTLDDVDLLECPLTGMKLLDVVVGYERVIIIDTIKKENPVPGRTYSLKGEDLRHIPGPSPHYVSIPQAVEIGRQLGLKVPQKIDIIAIEAKNMYNLGEGLTEKMTKAIPKIMEKLRAMLEKR